MKPLNHDDAKIIPTSGRWRGDGGLRRVILKLKQI